MSAARDDRALDAFAREARAALDNPIPGGVELRMQPIATTQSWQAIASAPRDGTVIILTAFEDDGTPFGEEWPMQWAQVQRNGLFPGKVGMWTHPSGELTWNGTADEGGPTHWKPASTPLNPSSISEHVEGVGE